MTGERRHILIFFYHLNAYFCIKIIFNQSVSLALHKRWNFD